MDNIIIGIVFIIGAMICALHYIYVTQIPPSRYMFDEYYNMNSYSDSDSEKSDKLD